MNLGHIRSRRNAIAVTYMLLGNCVTPHAQPLQRVAADIDWSSAKQSIARTMDKDKEAISRFRASAIDTGEADKIALPVLIPPSGLVRASPELGHQKTSYAASFNLDKDARMTVFGSASSLKIPDESPLGDTLIMGGDDYLFEKTEDGADMNFARFGASYVIRISCQDLADKRCNSEDYLRSVADGLVVVGGQEP